jgi:NAD-dependent dihydropyrimidine dehydrogenase PreA subunit
VSCLTIAPDGAEPDLRARLSAPALNLDQALYVSAALPQTKRVMVKDEDVCLHCGLCAERCPTAAWDMRRSDIVIPYAGDAGRGVRDAGREPTPGPPASERSFPRPAPRNPRT